jgi:hypothetical protein
LAEGDVPSWLPILVEISTGAFVALLLFLLDRRASVRESARAKEADERHDRLLVTVKELAIAIKAGLEVGGGQSGGITKAVGSTVYPRIAGLLRMFISKWDDWQKLPQRERWMSPLRVELQKTVGRYSEEMLEIVSVNEGFLDAKVVSTAKTVSNALRQFALAQIRSLGPSDWEAMEKEGEDAYDQSKDLLSIVSKIETHSSSE